MENIFWLVGNQCICGYRKRKILEKYPKHIIYNLEERDENKIVRLFLEPSIWDDDKQKAYILNGYPQNQKKTVPIILSKRDCDLLIIITDNIDKRSILYKSLNIKKEEYPDAIDKYGNIDKGVLSKNKKIVTKISKWEDKETLDYIFTQSNYDTTRVLQEIDKIKTFLGEDIPSKSNISEIFIKLPNTIERTLENLFVGDAYLALEDIDDISKDANKTMLFLTAIIERVKTLLYWKILSKEYEENKISEMLFNMFGPKANNFLIEKNKSKVKECFNIFNIKSLLQMLLHLNQSIEVYISATKPKRMILERIVFNFIALKST